MKNRAVVSERGTVTIPGPVREKAGIHPGDIIEFHPRGHDIVLKHLVVKHSQENSFLTDDEWNVFDGLVQKQLKNNQYTAYDDLKKAAVHSRRLTGKK